MPDIYHDFYVDAPPEQVFQAVSFPEALDCWWTRRSAGTPECGTTYNFGFGLGHDWTADVVACIPNVEIEWVLTGADPDWLNTFVSLRLVGQGGGTRVYFCHKGWGEENAHFRTSSFCWAMYLRLLKRYVELGEVVPYESRLDA